MSKRVTAQIVDRVGVITLSDPDVLNAVSLDLLAELQVAFDDVAYGDKVRAIMITGEGRAFCAGANLSGGSATEKTDAPAPGLLRVINPLLAQIRRSPKPIVSAVNGVAAGVGVSLALMADLVVAAESAYFLLAFRRIGLVPDGGATWLLPRLIGKARAAELMMLGERLPAATAKEWGLINKCVADDALFDAGLQYAKALADGPASLALTRRLIWDSLDSVWHEQVEAEAYMQTDAARTADAAEGVAAFLEKRPARFTGR